MKAGLGVILLCISSQTVGADTIDFWSILHQDERSTNRQKHQACISCHQNALDLIEAPDIVFRYGIKKRSAESSRKAGHRSWPSHQHNQANRMARSFLFESHHPLVTAGTQ